MGHNQEDLVGLGMIFSMLSYLSLFNGEYEVKKTMYADNHLYLTLSLSVKLPQTFSNGNENFYLTGEGMEIRMVVPADNGRVRRYYPNYKDYVYLPEEDCVLPKSLGSCMDKKLFRASKPENCYTWFDCTGAFLENPNQQLQYLKTTLPCLLKQLS